MWTQFWTGRLTKKKILANFTVLHIKHTSLKYQIFFLLWSWGMLIERLRYANWENAPFGSTKRLSDFWKRQMEIYCGTPNDCIFKYWPFWNKSNCPLDESKPSFVKIKIILWENLLAALFFLKNRPLVLERLYIGNKSENRIVY